VHRLRSFWEAITAPTMLWPNATGALATWQRWTGAVMAVAFGQPGFFSPSPQTWRPCDKRVSYYSTTALKTTLERLVDFDRINAGREVRLSVGAVNVETADFAYFGSRDMTICPEHIMASGALPPGFPPIKIDGEEYWDGGLVSNTPLQYMVDYFPRYSRVIRRGRVIDRRLSMRCTSAIRSSAIPAAPVWQRICCGNGTTLDTRSTS
jgi:NTE family protein